MSWGYTSTTIQGWLNRVLERAIQVQVAREVVGVLGMNGRPLVNISRRGRDLVISGEGVCNNFSAFAAQRSVAKRLRATQMVVLGGLRRLSSWNLGRAHSLQRGLYSKRCIQCDQSVPDSCSAVCLARVAHVAAEGRARGGQGGSLGGSEDKVLRGRGCLSP